MSVTRNGSFEGHLDSLSERLAMPTVLMIWSMSFSYFPQIILRTPDDVKGYMGETASLTFYSLEISNFIKFQLSSYKVR